MENALGPRPRPVRAGGGSVSPAPPVGAPEGGRGDEMDIVFLIYGLSFLALGLVIVVWPREESRFALAGFINWLAAFAFVHGILEWTDLWRVVRGDNPALAATRPFILLASYVLLCEFGRRLLRASLPFRHWRVRCAEFSIRRYPRCWAGGPWSGACCPRISRWDSASGPAT